MVTSTAIFLYMILISSKKEFSRESAAENAKKE